MPALQQFGGRSREVVLTAIPGSNKKTADVLERMTFEGGIE
ncbi:hypothetical protein [Lacipirellula sp.]